MIDMGVALDEKTLTISLSVMYSRGEDEWWQESIGICAVSSPQEVAVMLRRLAFNVEARGFRERT